jgi:hypothetical protein
MIRPHLWSTLGWKVVRADIAEERAKVPMMQSDPAIASWRAKVCKVHTAMQVLNRIVMVAHIRCRRRAAGKVRCGERRSSKANEHAVRTEQIAAITQVSCQSQKSAYSLAIIHVAAVAAKLPRSTEVV